MLLIFEYCRWYFEFEIEICDLFLMLMVFEELKFVVDFYFVIVNEIFERIGVY